VQTLPEKSIALRLPLHELHVSHGAHMVQFAGYEMPMNYGAGILQEHLHTRAAAALFDVSHMGQLLLRPRSGHLSDAAQALERVVPADIVALPTGRQRYTFFTHEAGGIRDDLMVANLGEALLLVVNAACKEADEAHLQAHLSDTCEITTLTDRALLALQGPKSGAVLSELQAAVSSLRFMDASVCSIADTDCFVTRSGYTGEDGFEISVPVSRAELLADRLLSNPHVRLAGLGARDSLRLEAGLCLYGQDIDLNTTPVEAALEWAIPRSRRTDGARAGGFPGSDVILPQLLNGASRRRAGVQSPLRPIRAGTLLFADDRSDAPIGRVTSGGFGPSVGRPVAMGYIPTELSRDGTALYAQVRGERQRVTAAALPFNQHHYLR
jgi:aminomethyltransferase